MSNAKRTIHEVLSRIVKSDCIKTETEDKPLTGEPFYLSGYEMAHVLFEIEKRLHIRINEKDLLGYQFNTINAMASIINKYIAQH